ncbi:MAG TPA: rhodanese-like domain-containing protein [Armatimonadota bacterium]|jgi:rhodanese-related sulfurtransferase
MAIRTFREIVDEAKTQVAEVSAEELGRRKASEPELIVLDVREGEDFREAHLPGAISLPRGLLELKIDELTTDPERPIVCYCGGGSRSALAARTLQEMGYGRVSSLAGGMRGWKDEQRPTESG